MEKYVKVLDKKLSFTLLRNYVMVLWNYTNDEERFRAHNALFEYIGINRFDDTQNHHKYHNVIDTMVSYAFVCCGLTVNRKNQCRGKCGLTLTMQRSLFNMEEYLIDNNLLIVYDK